MIAARASSFLALILCVLLASSLGLGSVVHAREGVACVEISGGIDQGADERDQKPVGSKKSCACQHSGCHGHHAGIPATFAVPMHPTVSRIPLLPDASTRTAGMASDPGRRPPRA